MTRTGCGRATGSRRSRRPRASSRSPRWCTSSTTPAGPRSPASSRTRPTRPGPAAAARRRPAAGHPEHRRPARARRVDQGGAHARRLRSALCRGCGAGFAGRATSATSRRARAATRPSCGPTWCGSARCPTRWSASWRARGGGPVRLRRYVGRGLPGGRVRAGARGEGPARSSSTWSPSEGTYFFHEARQGRAGDLVPVWVDEVLGSASGPGYGDAMAVRTAPRLASRSVRLRRRGGLRLGAGPGGTTPERLPRGQWLADVKAAMQGPAPMSPAGGHHRRTDAGDQLRHRQHRDRDRLRRWWREPRLRFSRLSASSTWRWSSTPAG